MESSSAPGTIARIVDHQTTIRPGSELGPPAARSIWTDDSSGITAPAVQSRLHRCQRGNVSILMLFMGLVFYVLIAMVWNTGEVTSAKIETQLAADTAAYSSSVWTSRGVNIIAATNQHLLRDASALAVCVAVITTTILVPIFWIPHFSTAFSLIAGLFTAPAGFALLALLLTELGLYLSFLGETGMIRGDPVVDIVEIVQHIDDLESYQSEWIDVIPGLIEEQREALELYYDCDISLVRGDGRTQISPPLKSGNPLTSSVPFTMRWAYDSLATGSWYNDRRIRTLIQLGRARQSWLIGSGLGYLAGFLGLGFTHHILESQPSFSPLEFGAYGLGNLGPLGDTRQWEPYTIVATARKQLSNENSAQRPRYPLRFMAPGLYEEEFRPIAYAQSETINGIDGMLSAVNLGGVNPGQLIGAIPWRVWSDWGWQWTPRLTRGDLIEAGRFPGPAMPQVNNEVFRRDTAKH